MATAGVVGLSTFISGDKLKPTRRRGRGSVSREWTHRSGRLAVSASLDQLFLGVGVGLPCTVMECGDIIYRSTLPRSDALTITIPGVSLALAAVSYLWATPGVAPAFWDMFILAFLDRLSRPTLRKDDLLPGKKLGEGAFGVVYKAASSSPKFKDDLVLKKATEYGAVEIWMNERVRRACANSCADFVYGFLEGSAKAKGGGTEYWLIWRFEGEDTLADLMLSKEFPYNVETKILGETQDLPKGVGRENRIIQTIMRQLLFALDGLHSTGIVHRDIKPQNVIFSEGDRTFKIIDLGAAADLRVGINYIPKEFLLDPRYAAPEQYIMSTQTPSAPSAPVATMLSPVLWQMNLPDRFDIYSVGLIFLQMYAVGLLPSKSFLLGRSLLISLGAFLPKHVCRRIPISRDLSLGFWPHRSHRLAHRAAAGPPPVAAAGGRRRRRWQPELRRVGPKPPRSSQNLILQFNSYSASAADLQHECPIREQVAKQQQVFPSLRSDSSLIQFNRQLKRCGFDMAAWRKTVEPRASPELRRGFELLDLDGGIGWELVTSMVRYKARQRTSAKAALAHPYFNREGLLGLSAMQNLRLQLLRATQKDYSEAANWIIGLMAKSGTEKEGGFTEAQLQNLREIKPKKASGERNALASVLRLQRKVIRTLNESMDELNGQRKTLWWSRWIPREE